MKYDRAFWDVTWNRPYGRYNKHHQAIWDAVLPYLNGNVADLGCGPCVMYRDKNINLTGVDISLKGLEEAEKNYPQGKYVLASADDTGLPDKSFDTVVMFGLLDLFNNWDTILTEAHRICKEDGKIFATLLNGFDSHDWTSYKHITGNWYLYEIK